MADPEPPLEEVRKIFETTRLGEPRLPPLLLLVVLALLAWRWRLEVTLSELAAPEAGRRWEGVVWRLED